jgi:hypothetical protein
MEWITGHERYHGPPDIPENNCLVWIHDLNRVHNILVRAIECLECDLLTFPNLAEATEERVTVSRQTDIAGLMRQRRSRNMTDAASQSSLSSPFDKDCG